MIIVWIALLAGSFWVIIFASKQAVDEVRQLTSRLGLPPFFVGLTLVAIGTDLPEIANSIVASLAQKGDLNAGDSIGSAVTQVTLVLGLLPFLTGAFEVGREQVVRTGLFTVASLILGTILVADGHLSRLDGLILVLTCIFALTVLWRSSRASREMPLDFVVRREAVRREAGSGLKALVMFATVGVGAAGTVLAFVKLSEILQVPEYLIAFFAGSLGTSLPELVVDVNAIRSRASSLAVGDLFGSSLVDATLSLGIGPLLVATPLTRDLAVRGGLTAAAVMLVVTLLFMRVRTHDWRSGLLLLFLYAAFYPILSH